MCNDSRLILNHEAKWPNSLSIRRRILLLVGVLVLVLVLLLLVVVVVVVVRLYSRARLLTMIYVIRHNACLFVMNLFASSFCS
jgi:hypothetical protein